MPNNESKRSLPTVIINTKIKLASFPVKSKFCDGCGDKGQEERMTKLSLNGVTWMLCFDCMCELCRRLEGATRKVPATGLTQVLEEIENANFYGSRTKPIPKGVYW